MAKAKVAEAKTSDEVPSKPAKELVSDEMKEAVEKASAAREEKTKDKLSGVGQLRKQGGGANSKDMTLSDVPYPVDAHGEDFELYGPSGAAAEIPEGTKIADYATEQEFVINPDKVRFLSFDKPNRNLPKKRLYTIKAIHKDGRLVQLPFEDQIQNTAGGDRGDAIGIRRYERKGITLLIDWETMIPVYCAAWGCWAQAFRAGDFVGFCALRHAQHTLPNQYKGAGAISKGLMEVGVTTTAVWGS